MEDLHTVSVRELIMRLTAIEQSIRSTATFSQDGGDATHRPLNNDLIDLARREDQIISELRRRENVLTPAPFTMPNRSVPLPTEADASAAAAEPGRP